MKESLLDIRNLTKSFGGVISVDDVSFSVRKEGLVLLTGGNGAGKTTLFNLITGLERPSKGSIIFDGEEISVSSPLKIARLGIVRMYQQPRLFKNLMVWENLLTAAHSSENSNFLKLLLNVKKIKAEEAKLKEKAIQILHAFKLEDLGNKIAGELSYGQQKLIAFCMIAMNKTKLALLDEPFAGLNPLMIDKLTNIILHMREKGITFLMIEHNLKKAQALCHNHIIMDEGKIIQPPLTNPLA